MIFIIYEIEFGDESVRETASNIGLVSAATAKCATGRWLLYLCYSYTWMLGGRERAGEPAGSLCCSLMVIHHILRSKRHGRRLHRRRRSTFSGKDAQTNARPAVVGDAAIELKLWLEHDSYLMSTRTSHDAICSPTRRAHMPSNPTNSTGFLCVRLQCFFYKSQKKTHDHFSSRNNCIIALHV